ncbi:MAG: hypothetical protein CL843_12040 [Crocinitomicaceae bacterium]|nr:hypothetical protein [Crocinitomicaceae bacterium]|tara:strand:+ start:4243 stop:5085 length:843 start_codon:yes stop_codon:yes gene_type:complete
MNPAQKKLFQTMDLQTKITGSILISLLFILSSCQKVIDIDLNSSDPEIVIEASIDQTSLCTVTLSRTVNFDASNNFPVISGAIVILNDGLNTDTLNEDSAGHYSTTAITGTPGTTYELYVNVEGETYTAYSTMPQPVSIDSVYIKTEEGFFGDDDEDYIRVQFYDPDGVNNYYRYNIIVNQTNEKLTSISDDEINQGELIERNLLGQKDDNDENQFVSGDTASVFLYALDKDVYDYYRTLNDLTGNFSAAAPANPLTNFNNNALGFFSAHAYTTYNIVIP